MTNQNSRPEDDTPAPLMEPAPEIEATSADGENTVPTHRAVFGRMGRNVAWLLGGRGFSGLVGLAYLAIAARAMGPHYFGVFTLVLAYGQAIANLMQFQSWQAVIRYGAVHLAARDEPKLARLLGFTATLDISSAVVGAGIAAVGVVLVAPLLGWDPSEMRRASIFGAALLLSIGATPNGILRLFDRFDLLTYCQAVGPIVRLAGSLTVWATGGGVNAFLAVWAGAALSQSAVTWVASLLKLDRRLSLGREPMRMAAAENRRIWRFMVMTNLSSSLSTLWEQIGTLSVGGAVGASAAGGFRLAGRLAKSLAKPVQTLARVLYPELAKLVASNDSATLRVVVTRVSRIAALLSIVLVAIAGLGGAWILQLLAGHAYRFAHLYLFVLAIAAAIDLSGFTLEPVLNAHGRAGRVLGSRAIGTAAYLILLACLLPFLGAFGAALAAIGGSVVVRIRLSWAARPLLRKGPEPAP